MTRDPSSECRLDSRAHQCKRCTPARDRFEPREASNENTGLTRGAMNSPATRDVGSRLREGDTLAVPRTARRLASHADRVQSARSPCRRLRSPSGPQNTLARPPGLGLLRRRSARERDRPRADPKHVLTNFGSRGARDPRQSNPATRPPSAASPGSHSRTTGFCRRPAADAVKGPPGRRRCSIGNRWEEECGAPPMKPLV